MKLILVVLFLITLAVIFLKYNRDGDKKKLLIALGSFALIVSFGIMGNLTRSVLPIYIGHIIFMLLSWVGLVWYLLTGKYYWWIIVSPVVTILLFVAMEALMGSGHEYLGEII